MTMKRTLYYFPGTGRAGAIRDTFRIGGVAFDDVHLDFQAHLARKAAGDWPFGAMPVLQLGEGDDALRVSQSNAILRYAGRLTGLYPADAVDALRVDEVLAVLEELGTALGPSFAERDMEKKLAMRAALLEGLLGRVLAGLDARAPAAGFLVGDALTIADLKAWHSVEQLVSGRLDGIPKDVLDGYPRLAAWFQRATAARAAALG